MLYLSALSLFAGLLPLQAVDCAAVRVAVHAAAQGVDYTADHAFMDRIVGQPSPDRASEIVGALAARFRAKNTYRVDFEIAMGEHPITGTYTVDGENYHLVLNRADAGIYTEVYADGAVRYEIDHGRREVTIDSPDGAGRNILGDPVHAFDFLDSDYTPALVSERDGKAVVLLTPAADAGALAGRITLEIDTRSMLPRSIRYDFDGETIEVRILRIGAPDRAFEPFDRAAYAAYEWIDFR